MIVKLKSSRLSCDKKNKIIIIKKIIQCCELAPQVES